MSLTGTKVSKALAKVYSESVDLHSYAKSKTCEAS